MRIIRINRHPRDTDIIMLATPPDLAEQMGRFEPARYSRDDRAYLIHRNDLDPFKRYAKHIGAHVIDERRPTGPKRDAHECGNCGQPGSTERAPRYCPSCGQDWQPVTYEDVSPTVSRGTCVACGHMQGARFPHCSRCGGQMSYPEAPTRLVIPRAKLEDPMPLGDVLAETVDQLAPTEETA